MTVLHESVMVAAGSEELTCLDFYCDLYRYSDAYIRYGDMMQLPVTLSGEDGGTWRSFALVELEEVCSERADAYVSACTYFPRRDVRGKWRASNGQRRADQLCAFVLDLDRGFPQNLEAALNEWWPTGTIPEPTFLVCSGNGLHLYYVLDQPVAMMTRWMRELSAVNNWLYNQYKPRKEHDWDDWEVSLGILDRHGLTQPYRVVGSRTKAATDTVSAWRVGRPYSISDLATAAGLPQTAFTIDEFDMSTSMLACEIARKKEQAATAKGGSGRGWNPGFYQWLFNREKSKTRLYGEVGHRYKQVQALSVAAVKDRIPRDQLTNDVRELWLGWNDCAVRFEHERIEWGECEKAMASFARSRDPHKYPKWWLEELCGFDFGTQKRNGRSQAEHLAKIARPMRRAFIEAGREDMAGGGRPTKAEQIRSYAAEHPEANHSEIARSLGVSRPTVIKWLRND